jgi:ketosteroid isomerase-like protein
LTGGCGVTPGTDAVIRIADSWTAAVRAKDAGTLCRLLTPAAVQATEAGGESCPQAIGGLDFPGGGQVGAVQVWSDRAEVSTGGDTVFLTKLTGGWRVSAAGCTAQRDQPYDCDVKG